MTTKEKKSGGKRPGAGRPEKDTTVFYCRVDSATLLQKRTVYGAKEFREKFLTWINEV